MPSLGLGENERGRCNFQWQLPTSLRENEGKPNAGRDSPKLTIKLPALAPHLSQFLSSENVLLPLSYFPGVSSIYKLVWF